MEDFPELPSNLKRDKTVEELTTRSRRPRQPFVNSTPERKKAIKDFAQHKKMSDFHSPLKHYPSTTTRKQVKDMVAVGIHSRDIAATLKIPHEILKKLYPDELLSGRIEANTFVATALYQAAVDGHVGAQIFWLKSRAGWTDHVQVDIGANSSLVDILRQLSAKTIDHEPQKQLEHQQDDNDSTG